MELLMCQAMLEKKTRGIQQNEIQQHDSTGAKTTGDFSLRLF
jgi:hypothetical protein